MEEDEPLDAPLGDAADSVLKNAKETSGIKRRLVLDESKHSYRSDAETTDRDSSEGTSFKKKRTGTQLSGSEENLLGYNENGVPELIKQEIKEETLEENTSLINGKEEHTNSPPRPQEKLKPKTEEASIVKQSRRAPKKNVKLENHKEHIVADNEESNETNTPRPTKIISDVYKKPFEYGWKRELVWRSNYKTSKVKADVYFTSPTGKKLRNRADIAPLLDGELTLENFCFMREPMGLGPDFESIRHAKNGSRPSVKNSPISVAAPTPTHTFGKRISKPKVPKGASPPPEGWTPARALKPNNAAAPRAIPPCTKSCTRGPEEVPQLKCIKCLRSFHNECVKHKGREYVCESCTLPLNKSKVRQTLSTEHSKSVKKILPQTISVVKGKKYVTLTKPSPRRVNNIENDIKQINESIRNNRNPLVVSLDVAQQTHKVAAIAKVDHSNKIFATNFFANVSMAYNTLICVFKYLKIHERPRAASVCKLWRLASKDNSLWSTVRMKNSKVSNWSGFTAALRRGETTHLDLRKMLLAKSRVEDMWQEFSTHIGTVTSLEIIDLCRCSANVVESLFNSNMQLRVLNAIAINDESLNLNQIHLLKNLEELRLRTCELANLTGDLQSLRSLIKLKHLSLTDFRGLGLKNIAILQNLTALHSLELGDCGDFDLTFARVVLPKLKQLQRLRLENGVDGSCSVLEILESCASLKQLKQIELINFDITNGFETALQKCTNIEKLLLIPTYIAQSASTNHVILSAVQRLADTLRVFTWGITLELMRVTALYVGQCESSPPKGEKSFDECIPVLKPVPGAIDDNDLDANQQPADTAKPTDADQQTDTTIETNNLPEIGIVPLDKVQSILDRNLPNTKFTIAKMPYNLMGKQQLVE